MADKKQEREARRAAREAAERKQRAKERRRTILAYTVAVLLVGVIVVGGAIAIVGGDSNSGGATGHLNTDETGSDPTPDAASINVLTGSVNNVPGDGRVGTPLAPVQQANLELAAEAASCTLNLDLKDEGNKHIEESSPDPAYATNPPTSGDHILPPLQQADGAYVEYPGDKYIVHSLEHGRIVMNYQPELPEDQQLILKGIFDEDPAGMVLVPNPGLPDDVLVSATAWTQMMTCETFEGDATVDAFRAFRDVYRGRGPEQVPIYIEQ